MAHRDDRAEGPNQEHGYENKQAYHARVDSGDEPGYLPCVYQVMDGEAGGVIAAWPIRLTRIRRS